MKDAEAVTFARGGPDRCAHLRGDPAAIAALAADSRARCLALRRGRTLVGGPEGAARLAWLAVDDPVFGDAPAPVFLGREADGTPRFARELPDAASEEAPGFVPPARDPHPGLPADEGFAELRAIMAQLPDADAAMAATARGLFAWHATHRFCAACGQPSQVTEAGWHRTCPACGTRHFPRTDPVVIMLVTHGNATLIGRQAAWPPGMQSLLAGFMEPGETVEAAVRRETFEETQVRVGRVDYLASQPWPFPANLMIGCHGHAETTGITIDPTEIESARWVTREEMAAAMAGEIPDLKPARHGSIARFLIERWLADRLD